MQNKSLVALALIVLLSCLEIGECWLFHHKDTVHKTVVDVYKCKCRVTCKRKAVCKFNCVNACGGKREVDEREAGSFDLLLPCRFEAWDLNKDNSIDLSEFAFEAHVSENDVNTKLAFKKSDENGDGVISRKEFNNAPLKKENC